MKNKFIKNIFNSFFIVNFGNALNYFTSIIIIRSLTIEDYSLYITFFSLLFFFCLPNLIFNQMILKMQNIIQNNYQIFKIVNTCIVIICFISFIILFNLSNVIKNFFKLNQVQYLEIYIILILILSLYWQFFSALFLKTRMYMTYNIITQSFFFLKFLFVLWLYMNKNANFEILLKVHIISQTLALLICIYFLKFFSIHCSIFKDKIKKFENFKKIKIIKFLVSIFIGQFLLFGLLNYDILICRKYCNEYEAGLYGAASTVSKIIYFLVTSVSIVLLREIFHLNEKRREYIELIIIISILLLIIYNLTYYLFSENLINILLDERYNSKLFIQISTTLNIGMSSLILSNFLIIYFLTTNKVYYFIKQILIMFSAFVITYLYNNESPQYIATIFLISSTCILSSLMYDFKKKNKPIY
jgi:O-antigen/teichoic acid export membrane protein